MLTLILLQPDKKPQRFRLDGEKPEVLGRHAKRLKLQDSRVSRQHAEIVLQDGAWLIRDLGSSNGTKVNGERIKKPRELDEGDEIRIGRQRLVVGHIAGDMSTPRWWTWTRTTTPTGWTRRQATGRPRLHGSGCWKSRGRGRTDSWKSPTMTWWRMTTLTATPRWRPWPRPASPAPRRRSRPAAPTPIDEPEDAEGDDDELMPLSVVDLDELEAADEDDEDADAAGPAAAGWDDSEKREPPAPREPDRRLKSPEPPPAEESHDEDDPADIVAADGVSVAEDDLDELDDLSFDFDGNQ